jgi:hypothetical protein
MNRGPKCNRLLRWLAGVIAGASYLLIFACNSPFIPIPPPNPTFTENAATPGEWQVHMPADSRAGGSLYYVYNVTTGSGLIQRASADGSMDAYPLQGQGGDHIEIHWERTIADGSSTICRPLGSGPVLQSCY